MQEIAYLGTQNYGVYVLGVLVIQQPGLYHLPSFMEKTF